MNQQARMLMGAETEYGFVLNGDLESAALLLLQMVRKKAPLWLPGSNSPGNVFLANGGQLYIDCGHPEFATPECSSPAELVNHILAGDRFLARDMARHFEQPGEDDPAATFFRNNHCYTNPSVTYGCHESYATATGSRGFAGNLVPHLCSRVIHCGSGGFDSRADNIQFVLSPRASHLRQVTGPSSTSERPIFHTKDEPLCDSPHHRVHLICGDSQRSARGMYLKIGTTAIIIRLIDLGHTPGAGVGLVDPLAALRRFSRDPLCRDRVKGEGGDTLSAIDIQRHYLEFAEARLGDLPDWAEDVCREWREVLDIDLRHGFESAANRVEWAAKYQVITNYIDSSGLDAADLERAEASCRRVLERLNETAPDEAPFRLTSRIAADLIHPPDDFPFPELPGLLRAEQIDLEKLERWQKLRSELFEIDNRWNQIGERSLFEILRREEAFDDRVHGVSETAVGRAIQTPPAETRARVRGHYIAKWGADQSGRKTHSVGWSFVNDASKKPHRTLPLNNPYEHRLRGGNQRWITNERNSADDDIPFRRHRPPRDANGERLTQTIHRALSKYDRGDLDTAGHMIEEVMARESELSPDALSMLLRYGSWIEMRRGNLAAAKHMLERRWGPGLEDAGCFQQIIEWSNVFAHCGLRPRPELSQWVTRGLARLESAEESEPTYSKVPFLGHAGIWRAINENRPREGAATLARARRIADGSGLHPFSRCRLDLQEARIAIRLGELERAAGLLDSAESRCRAENYKGELAEHVLLNRARLALVEARLAGDSLPSRERVRPFLKEAGRIIRAKGNRMGHAKRKLIAVRLGNRGWDREKFERLVTERDSLRQCGLAHLILQHWSDWINGRPYPGPPPPAAEGPDDHWWGL